MVRRDLRDDDLVGTFACPDGEGPFTPVLTLGGSDGGIAEIYLNLLVPEGFACLALAYFGTAHLQRSLVEVPLERVERGLRWLASQPQAASRDGRVALIGGSLGAISQRPLSDFPSRAAKHAAESKRGQHSQSMEPSRPTKAAVLQSPISA